MDVRIDPHTLQRAEERGTTAVEIHDVLATGEPISARAGRRGKAKLFSFEQRRLGRYYKHKRVEVIYTEEADTLVTVTVYVFFGEWEA